MDEPLPNLRAGLKNVGDGLHLERHDRLLRSLEAAAESFDSDKVKSATMALDAVMTFLRNERLEAPLRFLMDILDERKRKGRRTKPLDIALGEARLAATVDALMGDKGISLERACSDVARKAGGKMTSEELKNLRQNIRSGKARPEAVAVYRHCCRQNWNPDEEPPALLKALEERAQKR